METFDTSTAIGRAMLGIIMVFAELERENILLRVKDNYYARGEKGLYLGGVPIYGFDKIPTRLDGIKTSVLVPNSDMPTVEYIFSAYRESGCSLGDIVRTLNEQSVLSPAGTLWDSSKLSRLLRSPVYVCADMEVYRYSRRKARAFPTLRRILRANTADSSTAGGNPTSANIQMFTTMCCR